MDRVSLRKRLNNYVKSLLNSWGDTLFVAFVVFGFGTLLIMENLNHASKQMDTQNEMIDLINFNQQILHDQEKLRQLNIKQSIQIQQMDAFILQLYRKLQLYENLPDLPGDKEDNNPNRSEA